MRALQIGHRGLRATEPSLCPVPEPDATDGAHCHRARREPRHDQQRDEVDVWPVDEIEPHRVPPPPLSAGCRRSKYTRSIRRRLTRSTTMRTPLRVSDSPARGTRPNKAYTIPPTVVTSCTPKS